MVENVATAKKHILMVGEEIDSISNSHQALPFDIEVTSDIFGGAVGGYKRQNHRKCLDYVAMELQETPRRSPELTRVCSPKKDHPFSQGKLAASRFLPCTARQRWFEIQDVMGPALTTMLVGVGARHETNGGPLFKSKGGSIFVSGEEETQRFNAEAA